MDSVLNNKKVRKCIFKHISSLSPKQRKTIASFYNKPLDAEVRFYMSTLDANPSSKMARNWLLQHTDWLTPAQKRKLTLCNNMNNIQKLMNKL